jgi:four helix bundle protein
MNGRNQEWRQGTNRSEGRRGEGRSNTPAPRGGGNQQPADGPRQNGPGEKPAIRSYRELRVYQSAIEAAVGIHEATKGCPAEERGGFVEVMRRAAAAVCTHIGTAWRRRRSEAEFVGQLSEAEGAAEAVRVCIELIARCGYVSGQQAGQLDDAYDKVLAQLARMSADPAPWIRRPRAESST